MLIWPWSRIRALEQYRDKLWDDWRALDVERLTWQRKLDAAEAEKRAAIALTSVEQARRIDAEDRAERLLGEVLQMKREGFAPPAPNPDAFPNVPELPPVVENAINLRAQVGSPLHGKMVREAALKLATGMDPEVVASGILTGSSYNPFLE